MHKNFEAVGDFEDWPPNVPGKATQAAVFGMYHPTKGKTCEILWTGTFPDLEPAMYWAAKKEVEAVRKGKWMMASRVLWQHEMTPEQAVEQVKKQTQTQIDQAIQQMRGGAMEDEVDIGPGPMKKLHPGEAKGYYMEMAPRDDADADPLASFWVPGDPRDGEPALTPTMTMGVRLTLNLLRDTYTVCRLPHDAEVPAWAMQTVGADGSTGTEFCTSTEFCSISRSAEELSIICPSSRIPSDVTARADGWRGLSIEGPLDLSASGVLAMILLPLTAARIPALPVGTYNTDYLFFNDKDLERAIDALRSAGHTIKE